MCSCNFRVHVTCKVRFVTNGLRRYISSIHLWNNWLALFYEYLAVAYLTRGHQTRPPSLLTTHHSPAAESGLSKTHSRPPISNES